MKIWDHMAICGPFQYQTDMVHSQEFNICEISEKHLEVNNKM